MYDHLKMFVTHNMDILTQHKWSGKHVEPHGNPSSKKQRLGEACTQSSKGSRNHRATMLIPMTLVMAIRVIESTANIW